MSREVPAGRFFCMDEFHNHHMNDDVIRERLRSIDGIPGVSYQVYGDNVFVFEKLVQLVKQNGHNLATALDLVPQATMTASEAIEEWSVFPAPYSREINNTDHSQAIYHPYFNAYLPRKYPDRDACNADATRLLLGNPVEGEGDFVYRGQSMILRQPFTLDRLPPRPEWDVPVYENPGAYTHLWNTDFVSGFAPVSESLFNEVKSAEWEWNHAIAATCAYMGNPECFASLWPRAGEFGLEQLELKSSDVDELDPNTTSNSRLYTRSCPCCPRPLSREPMTSTVNRCGNTLRGATDFFITLLAVPSVRMCPATTRKKQEDSSHTHG